MDKKLVYDIGMHTGQDTLNYLRDGFRVVAVEASPILAKEGEQKFKKFIDDKSLIILNVGISDKEGVMPFYINKRTSEWSSFNFELGTRNNTPYEVVNVNCITTTQLIATYGTPYFLKVDIEGYDYLCVNDLPNVGSEKGIKYISCEASDVSLLDTLRDKGYTKFKIISQIYDFKPLNLKLEANPLFPIFLKFYSSIKLKLNSIIKFRYPYSSSGPIPEKTEGPWLTYEEARGQFRAFFQGDLKVALNNRSWHDFHATY